MLGAEPAVRMLDMVAIVTVGDLKSLHSRDGSSEYMMSASGESHQICDCKQKKTSPVYIANKIRHGRIINAPAKRCRRLH